MPARKETSGLAFFSAITDDGLDRGESVNHEVALSENSRKMP